MTTDLIQQTFIYDVTSDTVTWRYPHLHRKPKPVGKITRTFKGEELVYSFNRGTVSHRKIKQVCSPVKVVLLND